VVNVQDGQPKVIGGREQASEVVITFGAAVLTIADPVWDVLSQLLRGEVEVCIKISRAQTNVAG